MSLPALAFGLSLQAADLAPPLAYEGKQIEEIRFSPPTRPALEADVARKVQLQVGKPLRLSDVRGTIKQLYGTGEYADVAIDVTDSGNGVSLVVHTTDQLFVGPVEVEGKENSPPNRGQIASSSQLQLGSPFNDSDLDNAVMSIRRLLERNGLYRATIEPKIDSDPERQEVALTFVVEPGKRARFTEPIVIGDTRLPPKTVAKATRYKSIIKWKLATQQNTQGGIEKARSKYAKEERLTAAVSLDHIDYLSEQNRVRPTIKADGGPKVEIVRCEDIQRQAAGIRSRVR
jgi:outer membrane protein assembly factor BamA